MAASLPIRINPFRLAEQSTRLEGTLPIAHMSRLGDALASREGEARVRLNFMREECGLDVVTGELRTLLEMQCQRCLQPFSRTINRDFRLVIVHSDTEAVQLQAEHEVLEVQDGTVFTRDLVEDELLLSLPLIPTHDDPHMCEAGILEKLSKPGGEIDNDRQSFTRNPFAMLKDIKKTQKG